MEKINLTVKLAGNRFILGSFRVTVQATMHDDANFMMAEVAAK